jgi:uncharacterized protein YdaL
MAHNLKPLGAGKAVVYVVRIESVIGCLGVLAACGLGLAAGCGKDALTRSGAPAEEGVCRGAVGAKRTAPTSSAIWNPGPGGPGGPGRPGGVPAGAPRSGRGLDPTSNVTTLVLYDTTGSWGAIGELYAIGAVNLASHFGGWTARAAIAYSCGELARYDAVIYLGSTFDEPLPACLLDDVLASTRPVVWAFYNVWQLARRSARFAASHGFTPGALDFSPIAEVDYKGRALTRYAANGDGILGTAVADPAKATVLALARRGDGTTLPWAIRSGHLTYVSEIPFTYMTEDDRYLAFADLLFDALAPATPERHRAVVRLEDINPSNSAAQIQAVAEYLDAQGIPYGFGVVPEYRDPAGRYHGGTPTRSTLDQHPDLVATLSYMLGHGGAMVMHGVSHQWDMDVNPYSCVTTEDFEFYRVTENPDQTMNYLGPLPEDTGPWAGGRIDDGRLDFARAGLAAPQIFELPHNAGSVNAYRAIATRFAARWERAVYFPGLLRGTGPEYTRLFGQLFPYPVRDVYGTRVVPENLGNIRPVPFQRSPVRLPADIINAADKNLVVRDGVAGFYFHCNFDIQYLKDTIDGLRALGYAFVDPSQL